MNYDQLQHYSDPDFKRYCDVSQPLFQAKHEVLTAAEQAIRKPVGRTGCR